jgi:hypothetical protein
MAKKSNGTLTSFYRSVQAGPQRPADPSNLKFVQEARARNVGKQPKPIEEYAKEQARFKEKLEGGRKIQLTGKDKAKYEIDVDTFDQERAEILASNFTEKQLEAAAPQDKKPILVKGVDGGTYKINPLLFADDEIPAYKELLSPEVFQWAMNEIHGIPQPTDKPTMDKLREVRAGLGAAEAIGEPRRGGGVPRPDTIATTGAEAKSTAIERTWNALDVGFDLITKAFEEAQVAPLGGLGGPFALAGVAAGAGDVRVRNVIEAASGAEQGTIPPMLNNKVLKETFDYLTDRSDIVPSLFDKQLYREDEKGMAHVSTAMNIGMEQGNKRMITLGLVSGLVDPIAPVIAGYRGVRFAGKVLKASHLYGGSSIRALNAGEDLRTVAALRRIERFDNAVQGALKLSIRKNVMDVDPETLANKIDEMLERPTVGKAERAAEDVAPPVKAEKPELRQQVINNEVKAGPGVVEDVVTRADAELATNLQVLREVDAVMEEAYRLFPDELIQAERGQTRSGGVVEDVLGIEGRMDIAPETRQVIEEKIIHEYPKPQMDFEKPIATKINESSNFVVGYETVGAKTEFYPNTRGRYLNIDKPLKTGASGEEVFEVVVQTNKKRIFDPDGVLDGTDVAKSRKDAATLEKKIQKELDNDPTYTREKHEQKAIDAKTKILKKLGYEGSVNKSAHLGGDRELVIFNDKDVWLSEWSKNKKLHGGPEVTLSTLRKVGEGTKWLYDLTFETISKYIWKPGVRALTGGRVPDGFYEWGKAQRKAFIDRNLGTGNDYDKWIQKLVAPSEFRGKAVSEAMVGINRDERIIRELIDPFITAAVNDEAARKAFMAANGEIPVEQLNALEKGLYDNFVVLREKFTDEGLKQFILTPNMIRENYIRNYYDYTKMSLLDTMRQRKAFEMDMGYTIRRKRVMTHEEAKAAGLKKGEYITPDWKEEHLIKDIRAGFHGLKQLGYDAVRAKHMRHIFNDPEVNPIAGIWGDLFPDIEFNTETVNRFLNPKFERQLTAMARSASPEVAGQIDGYLSAIQKLKEQRRALELDKTYVLIPDQLKYGPMRNIYVKRHIYNDLRSINGAPDIGANLANTLDKIGVTEAYKQWKASKTVWNPATHARNIMWNAYATFMLADVNPVDFALWGDTTRQMLNKNSDLFKAMTDTGVFKTGFAEADLTTFAGSMQKSLEGQKTLKGGSAWAASIEACNRVKAKLEPFNFPKRIYGGEENYFKALVFNSEIHKAGGWDVVRKQLADGDYAAINEAAKKANKYLFDYSDQSTILQAFTKTPLFGSPFATFYSKFVPMFAEEVAKRPHRALLPYGIAAGMIYQAKKKYGDETVENSKKALPEWVKQSVPLSGEYGDPDSIVWWDWTNILPYMDALDLPFRQEKKFVEGAIEGRLDYSPGASIREKLEYGVSSKNPLSPVGAPIPRTVYDISANKDFAGRPIRTTEGVAGDRQIMDYVLRMLLPSIYPEAIGEPGAPGPLGDLPGPGGYGAKRIESARWGLEDPVTGMDRDITQARIKTYGGIDLQRTNVQRAAAFRVKEITKKIDETVRAIRSVEMKRRSTGDAYADFRRKQLDRELMQWQKELEELNEANQ